MLPRYLIGPIVLGFLALNLLGQALPLYTDYLWFQEVKFPSVFTTILWYKIALGIAGGLIFALVVYLNVRLAARPRTDDVLTELEDPLGLPSRLVIEPLFRRFLLPGAIILGILAGMQAAGQWETVLRFLNGQPFNAQDPLFGRDISFYVFRLPLLETLYSWSLVTLGIALLLATATYVLHRGIQITPRGPAAAPYARAHLLTLGALLLIVKAGGYYLDTYHLLLSPTGIVFGAGFSDINASLPALRVLAVLALGCAALCIWQLGRRGIRPVLIALGVLLAANVLGLGVLPNAMQRFRVVPNEMVAERPYIEQNIKYTRMAYGLDRIKEEEFPAEETLRMEDLRKNDPTIKNIRLWDHRPLLVTYAQLQEIRTYYRFVDVDNDRYMVDGQLRQVMLSPRELSYKNLPSRIWINERLTYTHGYGVVLGPVNRITPEGLPDFWIKDIPPVSSGPIKVTRPEVYYGEISNDYVFVKTRAQELDYPAGDKNVYTNYVGTGGVPIQSLFRKLLFAARFGDIKILLSNDIIGESRVMYHRQIEERVKKAAPFIQFDRDPYLVVRQDGSLVWIIDGYTTSNKFPYSEPVRGLGNYIRNSVKAVVDAYHGTLAFYLSEPDDPVIKTYATAFPGLFQPLSAMPADLKPHIRYPQGLFAIQARMFATYHMQDPQVFYNKEDLWSIPRRMHGRSRARDRVLLHHHAPSRRKDRGVHPAVPLQSQQEGQHDCLDGGPLRRPALRQTDRLQLPEAEADLRSPPDRGPDRSGRIHLAAAQPVEPARLPGHPRKHVGHPHRAVPALCPAPLSRRREGLAAGAQACDRLDGEPDCHGREPGGIAGAALRWGETPTGGARRYAHGAGDGAGYQCDGPGRSGAAAVRTRPGPVAAGELRWVRRRDQAAGDDAEGPAGTRPVTPAREDQ